MDVDDTEIAMILSEQRREVTAAVAAVGSDLDVDFQLQMQEAIAASLTSKPCSSSSNDDVFSVYFKGLVINETVMNVKMLFAGIGVAICDSSDSCIFESRKSYLLEAGSRKTEGDVVELQALIEALNSAAVSLGLKRLHIFCDSNSVYDYLTSKVHATSKKIVTMVEQLNLIQRQFAYCSPFLVSQNQGNFAYKLARDAINSEATKWAETDSGVTIVEQCTICFECVNSGQMFSVNKCRHRYCFSCMRKHVEAKLLQGKLAECPHEKCKSSIEIESCKKFLNSELYEIMSLRIKEASIPLTERVYCPFSNCSALMSKTEVQEYTPTSSSSSAQGTMRKCVKCNRLFCISCQVPWHDNITCSDYMKSFLFLSSNEAKLKSLAKKNRWRQCIKCKNLVELATGCLRINCRCGHQFCYGCGADAKSTCRCLIWVHQNIIYPKIYNMMSLRIKEASVPPTEKVYCPFFNCSALMSKTEVQGYTVTSSDIAAGGTAMRKCVECNRLFCISCKVPWHDNITCADYMKWFPFQSANDAKLKSLATRNRWRQCIRCKNLVELPTGCYHISCRCGHEFCYTCGAEWINKKPTCRCPIWDVRNIIDRR